MPADPARSRLGAQPQTQVDSSCSTFCEKAVCSCASRSTICASRAFASAAEPGAGEHEVEVHPLQQALRLGVEAKRRARLACSASTRANSFCVQIDRAFVRGEPRRHVALDRLQRRRGLGRGQVEEHLLDAGQPAAAASNAAMVFSKVGASGFAAIAAISLGVLAHGRLECRYEMLSPDPFERRQLEGRIPSL